jgi:GxxExxY protein
MNTEKEILLANEVYEVIGAAFAIYNELGAGFLEPVYQKAMEIELNIRQIAFQSQSRLAIFYKQTLLQKEYVADLIVFGSIIVELKAIEQIESREKAQLLNYLKATGKRVGVLTNFGAQPKLQWIRRVL